MTIEEEMRREIKRLENDLELIDAELQKLQGKIVNLINIKKKKEHNLSVLKANFGEVFEERRIQTTLEKLMEEL